MNLLLAALAASKLAVVKTDGKLVHLAHDYLVEVEGPSLFKLSEDGYIVGPFDTVSELVDFIKQDLVTSGKVAE